jgi:hypothetical protein
VLTNAILNKALYDTTTIWPAGFTPPRYVTSPGALKNMAWRTQLYYAPS